MQYQKHSLSYIQNKINRYQNFFSFEKTHKNEKIV